MDPTAVPSWDSVLKPVEINPVPDSFVHYFPCDNESNCENNTATDQKASWITLLAPPASHLRLPAWNRVAVQPQTSNSIRTQIFKRVESVMRAINKHNAVLKKPTAGTYDEDKLAPASRRRRTDSYAPNTDSFSIPRSPLTVAETYRIILDAKVDVVNSILKTPSSTTPENIKRCRFGVRLQTVPQKRRQGDVPGGNRADVYGQLIGLVDKALSDGRDSIDSLYASIAETSIAMQDIRRDPRQRIAVHGVPDLSDITDMAEPESPPHFKAPVLKAEAKSPTKRLAKLTTPIRKGLSRLGHTFVKLDPIADSKTSPSPTKLSSSPSTPLRDSPSPKRNITPSALGSSPISASFHNADEEFSRVASPGRTFRVPSDTDASSIRDGSSVQGSSPIATFRAPPLTYSSLSNKTIEQSPTLPPSTPIKRPVAPTPSRGHRAEPTTPQTVATMPATPTPCTPDQVNSPIGLAAFTYLSTPKAPFHGTPMSNPNAKPDYDFGNMSPSFNAISWAHAPSPAETNEPRRVANLLNSRRRQSEPLFRKYIAQQARRQSISPQKLSFKDKTFCDQSSLSTLFASAVPDTTENQLQEHVAPMNDGTPTKIGNGTDPIDQIDVQQKTPTAAFDPATLPMTNEHGVLNIDIRTNPDIFAAQPTPPAPAAVDQLAKMVEDHCAGQANVFVEQQNGRLVVRFKLPAEYIWMFPQDQGADESHFSSSPPTISSSPQIRFDARLSLENSDNGTSSLSDDQAVHSSLASNNLEHTALADGIKSFARSKFSNKRVSFSGIDESSTLFSPAANETPALARMFKSPRQNNTSSPTVNRRSSARNRTSLVQTPETTAIFDMNSPMFSQLPSSAKPLSPLEATPTNQRHSGTPTPAPRITNQPTQQTTHTPAITADAALSTSANITPTATSEENNTRKSQSPPISFTPVNQAARSQTTAAAQETTASAKTKLKRSSPKEPAVDAQSNTRAHDYDSPGRDYIQNFINRSRPRNASSTDTSSPVPAPVKRQPLGAKSPNTSSPDKAKRKHDSDEDKDRSPTKELKEPPAKRTRRAVKQQTEVAVSEVKQPETAKEKTEIIVATTVENQTEKIDSEEDKAEKEAPTTRSSSRLRGQGKAGSGGPKSSILTPIKIGGRSGAGSRVMPGARKDQQDLQAQTRKNTKRNRGNAEYPTTVLAKYNGQMPLDATDADRSEDEMTAAAKGNKQVVWREPLESFQEAKEAEEEKSQRGKAAVSKSKPRATQGKTGIAKPKASGPKKNLGTAGKPSRVTRSRTRSQAN